MVGIIDNQLMVFAQAEKRVQRHDLGGYYTITLSTYSSCCSWLHDFITVARTVQTFKISFFYKKISKQEKKNLI